MNESISMSGLLNKINELEKRLENVENKIEKKQPLKLKQLSVKEFILLKPHKSDVKKCLIIGYYLENYGKMDSFNVKDLEKGFRNAKEKVPNNINLCIIKNIEKGFIMEDSELKDNFKAWVLTNSGENEIVEKE